MMEIELVGGPLDGAMFELEDGLVEHLTRISFDVGKDDQAFYRIDDDKAKFTGYTYDDPSAL